MSEKSENEDLGVDFFKSHLRWLVFLLLTICPVIGAIFVSFLVGFNEIYPIGYFFSIVGIFFVFSLFFSLIGVIESRISGKISYSLPLYLLFGVILLTPVVMPLFFDKPATGLAALIFVALAFLSAFLFSGIYLISHYVAKSRLQPKQLFSNGSGTGNE